IGGTRYAGELKKSVFTILNYLLPKRRVLSMHCAANLSRTGDAALFFLLSGTGKTTLSAEPERALTGDDEQGWSDLGVFNFEGGCYAKVIRLSREGEPEIFAATRMFGTVLENVVVDPMTRAIDLDSAEITENTRASYPIHYVPNHVPGGMGGHPSHVVFLTCDAYGIRERFRLGLTRAMVRAALAGTLDRTPTAPEPVFGLEVPLQVPGIPDELLLPRGTWSDPAAYDAQAARLGQMFRQNFEQFRDLVHAAVREAGPRL